MRHLLGWKIKEKTYLEKAGLRIPEYRCNAFMLQTVIYNSGAKNTAIQPGNPTIQNEKTDFEVEKVLGCSTTTSKELMKKLRDMQVVIEVKGMGKGKYRLVYESEVK